MTFLEGLLAKGERMVERTDWLQAGFDASEARFLMLTAITHHRFSSPAWGEAQVRQLYAELAEIDAAITRAVPASKLPGAHKTGAHKARRARHIPPLLTVHTAGTPGHPVMARPHGTVLAHPIARARLWGVLLRLAVSLSSRLRSLVRWLSSRFRHDLTDDRDSRADWIAG